MKLWQARIAILMVAMMWGLGYIAIDSAIQYMSVPQMQIPRFILSTILIIVLFRKKLKNISKRAYLYGIALGFIFFLGVTVHSVALETTTISKNSFLVVLTVVFVPIIMYFVYKVKIAPYFIHGVITIIIGFVFLVFNIDIFNLSSSLGALEELSTLVLGDYLTILAALLFSIHVVMVGHYVSRESAIKLTTVQMGTAAILSLIYVVLTGETIPFIGMDNELLMAALPAILYLGISGAFAFGGQIVVQKYLPSSNVAIITSTDSLFATSASVVLGLEMLSAGLIVGAIVIILGIIWAETGFNFK
jgi:drug/metabolite transporter (DMT)-like permease